MQITFNDLSLHGQFESAESADAAVRAILEMRTMIRSAGHGLRAPRLLIDRSLTPSLTLRDVVSRIRDTSLRVLALMWLQKEGPFWDDEPSHGDDDYVECNGEVVTGSGIAEAAVSCIRGGAGDIVSAFPSRWAHTPLVAEWAISEHERKVVSLENCWESVCLGRRLASAERDPTSWEEFAGQVRRDCPNLVFADNVVEPLRRSPYWPGAARQMRVVLKTLDALKQSFAADGGLSPEGMKIYQRHFVGKKAWFSDSSNGEKRDFASEMTFLRPGSDSEYVFCPWHGKVKIEQLRVHFTYPITASDPTCVVYIGPKITKR